MTKGKRKKYSLTTLIVAEEKTLHNGKYWNIFKFIARIMYTKKYKNRTMLDKLTLCYKKNKKKDVTTDQD